MTNKQTPKGKFTAAILRYLESQDRPRSAYEILDALHDEGAKAPMQIYRALAKLESEGLAHKLAKSNSWIACHHPHDEAHLDEMLVILSCQSCGVVEEVEDKMLQDALHKLTKKSHFDLPAQTIEVDGLCHPCKDTDKS